MIQPNAASIRKRPGELPRIANDRRLVALLLQGLRLLVREFDHPGPPYAPGAMIPARRSPEEVQFAILAVSHGRGWTSSEK
jgi:hypothetical protein